jgi:hypothetical protein
MPEFKYDGRSMSVGLQLPAFVGSLLLLRQEAATAETQAAVGHAQQGSCTSGKDL